MTKNENRVDDEQLQTDYGRGAHIHRAPGKGAEGAGAPGDHIRAHLQRAAGGRGRIPLCHLHAALRRGHRSAESAGRQDRRGIPGASLRHHPCAPPYADR